MTNTEANQQGPETLPFTPECAQKFKDYPPQTCQSSVGLTPPCPCLRCQPPGGFLALLARDSANQNDRNRSFALLEEGHADFAEVAARPNREPSGLKTLRETFA